MSEFTCSYCGRAFPDIAECPEGLCPGCYGLLETRRAVRVALEHRERGGRARLREAIRREAAAHMPPVDFSRPGRDLPSLDEVSLLPPDDTEDA